MVHILVPCNYLGPTLGNLKGGLLQISLLVNGLSFRLRRTGRGTHQVLKMARASQVWNAQKSWNMGHGTIYSGVPSFLGFGVGEESYSNFLAFSVEAAGASHVVGGSRLWFRFQITPCPIRQSKLLLAQKIIY